MGRISLTILSSYLDWRKQPGASGVACAPASISTTDQATIFLEGEIVGHDAERHVGGELSKQWWEDIADVAVEFV